MNNLIYKRILTILMLLSVVIFSAGLAGIALAYTSAMPKTLDRNLEPVIIKAINVIALNNTPPNQLFLYAYNGSALVQIPIQVDEKTIADKFAVTGDGLFNNKDEIAFMAKDLGDKAPNPAALLATKPISNAWYEIEVVDPTAPTKKGWAYLVRSGTLTPVPVDYVSYNDVTRRMSGSTYQLGLASTFPGFNYLTLNSGPNILDRTKLRAIIDAGIFGIFTVDEDDLTNPGVLLIKDGPVRVILEQSAAENVAGNQAKSDTTFLAYPALVQATANTTFTLIAGNLTSIRTSIDLNSAATGATFFNANTAGVLINGSPDAVPSTLSTWTQISHTSGRAIQVTDLSQAGGTPTTYYCDNNSSSTECDGTATTGDGASYGESGFVFGAAVNNQAVVENWLFILPAGGNIGSTYQGYFNQRLAANAVPSAGAGLDFIYLPLVVKQ